MKRLICLILLVTFSLEIVNPVYAIEIEDWEADYEYEYTLPGVGLDADVGPDLLDPIPGQVSVVGECLITPILAKDLAFLNNDVINTILAILDFFNITLKITISLPTFSAKIRAILNFLTSKLVIKLLNLFGMNIRGILMQYLGDRISCLTRAQMETGLSRLQNEKRSTADEERLREIEEEEREILRKTRDNEIDFLQNKRARLDEEKKTTVDEERLREINREMEELRVESLRIFEDYAARIERI